MDNMSDPTESPMIQASGVNGASQHVTTPGLHDRPLDPFDQANPDETILSGHGSPTRPGFSMPMGVTWISRDGQDAGVEEV